MIIKQTLPGQYDFDYKWYDIYNLDEQDIKLLQTKFQLTTEIIQYITDLHERPHFDHDYITNSDLLVYDVPIWPTSDADHFTTLPIKFLMVDNTLFTVHTPDTTYMIEEFRQKADEDIHSEKELIFAILISVTRYFQRALNQLNSQRVILDRHLSGTIKNRDLQELAQVEKSLVYLSSSIRTNLMMLESLKNHKSGLHMNKSEEEMCDDIIIEVQQSSQMVKIYNEVTEEISKTSNNILNNNLNNTMQFLTVWSLLLTVPTIATGFFGMNVDLPVLHNPLDWVFISIGTIIVMAALLWYFKKHNML
ncbi:magnesium transporter CorA family protein [Lactobacillus sp.]|uniref:magnesium transporter CorA family protein n=1 Tax=Lactobacillus sp. TaxID=1591 RepID=UPI0019A1F3B4|nr:magnesium transporter CorA family protein [Lactobacillus sp.]MBD5429495.1 magnesium transporter CorA family protein [Lactobacillus sp.]